MTTIKFFKNREKFIGFECSGHTGYAKAGNDILCSAVSALTQSAVLGIVDVLGIEGEFDKEDGFLRFFPNKITDETELIFKVLYNSLSDLMKDNEKYIQVETVKRS